MATLKILEYPDPRLKLRAEPVTDFDEALHQLVDDLLETLYTTEHAIGLSAPQVGIPRQVLVMDLSKDRSAPEVYINPKVVARALFGFVEESCLSVPGELVNAWRATAIRVRAQDCSGEVFERELERMYAVCVQHEMDHFKGKLLTDRMSIFRRFRYDRRLRREAA